ncbi:MAG: SPOR domain-containing protein [Magnetococcales bacterium]|nr:SPOR domain-containing protein [Magnetococcales bacterium]
MITSDTHRPRPRHKPGSWMVALLVFLAFSSLANTAIAKETPSKGHPRIWIYPLEGADGSKVDEAQATRVLNAIHQALSRLQGFQKLDLGVPAYLLPTGAPDPRTSQGATQLSQLGADYIVGYTLVPGQAGFLALELYHPPQSRMVWLALAPLANDTDLRQATGQLALQLAEHLQRIDNHLLIAMSPLSALQAIAAAPATAAQTPPPRDPPKEDLRYSIQVEASLAPEHAYNTIRSLRSLGYEPRLESAKDADNHKWHYVRMGSYPDRQSAQTALQAFLEKSKLPAVLVIGTAEQKSETIPARYLARNQDGTAPKKGVAASSPTTSRKSTESTPRQDDEEEAAEKPGLSPRTSPARATTRPTSRQTVAHQGVGHRARSEASYTKGHRGKKRGSAVGSIFDIRVSPSQIHGSPDRALAYLRKKGYRPHVHKVHDSRHRRWLSVRVGPIRGARHAAVALDAFRQRTGLKATLIPTTR